MAIITENGDIMAFGSPAILDEWGRRRINGLLEDGTLIIILFIPPPSIVRPVINESLTWYV